MTTLTKRLRPINNGLAAIRLSYVGLACSKAMCSVANTVLLSFLLFVKWIRLVSGQCGTCCKFTSIRR